MVAQMPMPTETPESNQTRLSTVKSLRIDGSDCKSAFLDPGVLSARCRYGFELRIRVSAWIKLGANSRNC
jgi:hypothetical protein